MVETLLQQIGLDDDSSDDDQFNIDQGKQNFQKFFIN